MPLEKLYSFTETAKRKQTNTKTLYKLIIKNVVTLCKNKLGENPEVTEPKK